MNAILLLCQNDSIVNRVFAKAIPVIQETYEAGTNSSDVSIAEAICKSLVIIVAICVGGFLLWKLMDYVYGWRSENRKQKWDIKEKDRKQKSDLLDKYLDFLKEQTKEKDYVTMEEYEKQRKEFMNQLLELLKDEKLVCLNPSGENNTTPSNTATSKDSIDNKQTETEKSPNDKKKTAEEEKKDAVQYLIDKLNKYNNSKKSEPAIIDQTKINQYRQTLEYLIQLSQQGKLDEFTIEKLKELLN